MLRPSLVHILTADFDQKAWNSLKIALDSHFRGTVQPGPA